MKLILRVPEILRVAADLGSCKQLVKVPMRREGDGSGKRSSTAFRQRVDTLREANGAQWLLMG
jgi:hypothetical protein